MSGGRLTIWIDGREALPVRAIPYVTVWEYSPDVVAESLARMTAPPFAELRNLVAYHRPTAKPLPVMADEWAAVVAEIKGFEARLREQRPDTEAMDDHAGYAAWRKEAALKLPAGVFVWLDEFLREREADHKRTPDDRPVTLAPMLDDDTRAAVLEGFEDCPRRGPDADRAMIGYADFVAICQVDDPKNFGGFRAEANGLYVDLPDAEATQTPEERAAVSWHPTGQYDKPALPLPCTLGQLRAFLPDAGMAGYIDEEAADAVLADELPTDSGRGGGAVKFGAGATAPRESKQAVTITTNRLKTRIHPLDAVIGLATKTALAKDDHQSVWAELVKLAESEARPAPLAGYSSDGIQYKGKVYEEKQEFDIYTKKNLRDKMARDKAR